jgi:glycosyltransferase involved in cell wall biosynthesis
MLTGVVLVKNESKNIGPCLESLKFCDSILVVDDNSTDTTPRVAQAAGAKVVKHALNDNFGQQRNWAIDQVESGWILFVDADEKVSPRLQQEILTAITKIEYKGFYLRRLDYIWGKPLRFGDAGGAKIVRLGRKGAGEWAGEVHELWQIEGRTGTLKSQLIHNPHSTLVEFLRHINYYSTIKANQFFKQQRPSNILHIALGPIWRFIKSYILKLGMLDGTVGFVHAMIVSFYAFLVAGKLYLLGRGIPHD